MKFKNNKMIFVKVRYKLQKYIIKLEQRKIANTIWTMYDSSRFVSKFAHILAAELPNETKQEDRSW